MDDNITSNSTDQRCLIWKWRDTLKKSWKLKVALNSWGCFIEDLDDNGQFVTHKRREGNIIILDDNMVKYVMHVKGQNTCSRSKHGTKITNDAN